MKNKLEPDWDFVEQVYGDNEASKQKSTDGQAVAIIPLKKDDVLLFVIRNRNLKLYLRHGISLKLRRGYLLKYRKIVS